MELKKGYKQTEVGIIPLEWDVKPISKVAPLQRGFDLPTTQLVSGDYPVVYSNGILNYHHKAMVKAPGVVTGRSGTIGKVNYIENDYWPHNTTLWVTDFKGNLPKFIYYFYGYLKLERFGTGSGVPTLNRNDVHEFKVAIPPISEQRAIAAALSDLDALISALDELIAKKHNIKQGAMQKLLTGKRRLPGFGGEWETLNMAEHSTLKARIGWQGLTVAEYLTTGEYRLITGTDFIGGKVDWEKCHYVEKNGMTKTEISNFVLVMS
jgi:type I restriction enzyme S subunit